MSQCFPHDTIDQLNRPLSLPAYILLTCQLFNIC